LSKVLVENSKYTSFQRLKARLIAEGLLKQECAVCKMNPVWMGKTLILAMDHVNGVKNDLRIENLRLLCPNCHSQTDTFAGRNRKYPKKDLTRKCRACDRKFKPSDDRRIFCSVACFQNRNEVEDGSHQRQL
jgi:Zn finger protein HypA/HybF involved in hydrogenase expression